MQVEAKLHAVPEPEPARSPQAGTTAFGRLRADLQRYYGLQGAKSLLARLRSCLSTEAIWAVAVYRFGQYLQDEAPGPVRIVLRIPLAVVHRVVELVTGIHLTVATEIGPGFYIGHYGGIWISPRSVLGANCNVNHHVTIGSAAGRGAPVLGDRVWVGPGVVISGPIRIGSGAVIGGNSLVATELPENAVAIGVPARVVSLGGSAHLVRDEL